MPKRSKKYTGARNRTTGSSGSRRRKRSVQVKERPSRASTRASMSPPTWRRPATGRPGGPRHGRSAPRDREVPQGAGDLPGRQGGRGRGGRRGLRRNRVRGPHQGRMAGLRRVRGHPRPDAHGRAARAHPRSPWPDAHTEGRHRDLRRGPGGRRDQGGQDRVPRGQDRQPARADRQGCRSSWTFSPRTSAHSWRRCSGPSPRPRRAPTSRASTVSSTMGPGVHVDPNSFTRSG